MAVIPLIITVVMGIMGGGMVALAMIAPRQTQNIYGILALFGLVFGLAAVIFGPHPTLIVTALNSLFNLVLAGFIGYAVTTFFVLSYQVKPDFLLPDLAGVQAAQAAGPGKTAVIFLVAAEPDQYEVRAVARGLDTIDYPQALPPPLLRPLYLLDLKRKYEMLKRNPYRDIHFRLAQKVQDRLGKRYKVYIAFYNDHPALDEAAVEAIRNGARRLIVLHVRLTDPPPTVRTVETLEALRPARYGVAVVETSPLWNSELLPRLFVRRALAATEGLDRATTGLILVGQGHPLPRRLSEGEETPDPLARQHQELTFEKRVRQALIRAGFADENVVLAWRQWQHPTIARAAAQLAAAGCPRIFWLASGFLTDGIATLVDIPHLLISAAGSAAEISALGPWNDDDIVAEALVEKVKQVAAVEQLT